MTLGDLDRILIEIGYFKRKFLPSKLVTSLEEVYDFCKNNNANLDRELTVSEYHQLYNSCLWKFRPSSDLELKLFMPLRTTECARLGFSNLPEHHALFEYLQQNNALSLEIIENLFVIRSNKDQVEIVRILEKLAASLWTMANLNKLISNHQQHGYISALVTDMLSNITKQQTFDLLIDNSVELDQIIWTLRARFNYLSATTESGFILFSQNIWLFKNQRIIAYLDNERPQILSERAFYNDSVPYLVEKAKRFANLNGIEEVDVVQLDIDNPENQQEGIEASMSPPAVLMMQPLPRLEGSVQDVRVNAVQYSGVFFARPPTPHDADSEVIAMDGRMIAPPGGLVVNSYFK